LLTMLGKRACAFAEHGLDASRSRVAVSDETIEKQKQFFESILVKRKVEELKANTAQTVSFD